MRAPEFWSRRSPLALALAPLGVVYGLAARLRQAVSRPHRVPVPVICVGNLTVGGAGKTPTALALAQLLRELGQQPHFLTRGYGGRLRGPVRVDPAFHAAADVGDEPLLLAAEAPCWVSRDRAAGARAAVAAGASAIVMDDGLQNTSLAKTLAFAVLDGAAGVGNGLVLPAGPLREFVADGLARVQALVAIGPVAPEVARLLHRVAGARPVLGARFVPDASALAGRRVLAFAGIARPEKFFAGLRDQGCLLVESRAFPDHHRYRGEELAALRRQAEALDAVLATTAKDHVRLAATARGTVIRVDGRMRFDRPEAVAALLAQAAADQ
jgi:tetraacyldisaccharide 4'-kinase